MLATAHESNNNQDWTLTGTLYLIQVEPSPGEATLLQAEMSGSSYVLCFTSDDKARSAIARLEVDRALAVRVPGGQSVDLVAALCQVGAVGIIVDLDPQTKKCAWSRRITVAA